MPWSIAIIISQFSLLNARYLLVELEESRPTSMARALHPAEINELNPWEPIPDHPLISHKPLDYPGYLTKQYFKGKYKSNVRHKRARKAKGTMPLKETCKASSLESWNPLYGIVKFGVPCIFPFRLHYQTFHSCTYYLSQVLANMPWCSTKVDEKGNHVAGNLGICDPTEQPLKCPIETAPVGEGEICGKCYNPTNNNVCGRCAPGLVCTLQHTTGGLLRSASGKCEKKIAGQRGTFLLTGLLVGLLGLAGYLTL